LRLASFYQSTVLGIQEYLTKFQTVSAVLPAQAPLLHRSLNIARHRLVSAFRVFVHTLCIGPLLGESGAAEPDLVQARGIYIGK
jgi:hypothetical protein